MTASFDEDNLEELKKFLNEANESYVKNHEALSKQKALVAELAKQYQAASMLEKQLERERQTFDFNRRDLEKRVASAQRIAEAKAEKTRLESLFAEEAAKLDALTASAHWREFALDHQIDGGKRLAVAKCGILGDKRGLGKTLTSLIWCDMVQAKKVLVIAPNDVVSQFEEEIRTWAPARTVFPLRGLSKSERNFVYPMLKTMDEFIVTLNYEAWRRDKSIIDDLLLADIDTIICDEAHRIKASDKVTARGVFQLRYRPNKCLSCGHIANHAGPWQKGAALIDERAFSVKNIMPVCAKCESALLTNTVENVLMMTGTPILNKPQELFSMLYMVNRDLFPSEKKFLDDYCWMGANNRWTFNHGGLERLTKFMSSFFVQRTREEAGIELPPPAIHEYLLEKDKVKYSEQYRAEEEIAKKAQLLLADGTRKDIFFVLELILRERQCMTWPAGIRITDPETKEVICNFDVEESQKLDAATELLSDLCEEEERVIVFSQFKAPLYEMKRRIEKAGYRGVMATGDQTEYQKDAVRRDFDIKSAPEKPRWQVCFATYKAFGTGINLNAAHHMIMLDDEWNPGMQDQAIGRIDRLNSEGQANVHIFRVKNSIDDFMAALLEEKRGIVNGFNESVTASDLLNFFK